MNSKFLNASIVALGLFALPFVVTAKEKEKPITQTELQAAIEEHHNEDVMKAREAQEAALQAEEKAKEERRREQFFRRSSRER